MEQINYKPKIYIILGMHRSGTSFLAKSLFDQGIDMGDVDQNKDHTLYEDFIMATLNNKILACAEGYWDEPPTEDNILKQKNEMKYQIRDTLGHRKLSGENQKWGWKDPRTVLTLPAILPHVDTKKDDTYLICIFRKKSEVINSLVVRGKMDEGKASYLYDLYNERIVSLIEDFIK